MGHPRPGGLGFEKDPQVNGKGKDAMDGERYETEGRQEAENDGALGGRSSRRARKCPRKLRRAHRNYASQDCNASVKSRDVLAVTSRCVALVI